MKASVARQLSNLFDDAYDEIDTEGWARGTASDPAEGPCCVTHAIYRVANRTNRLAYWQRAMDVLAAQVGDTPHTWNDRQHTSYPVLRVLEALADRYRRQP